MGYLTVVHSAKETRKKVQQFFRNSRSCNVLIKTVKNTLIAFIGSAIYNKVTHRLLCTVLLSLPIS